MRAAQVAALVACLSAGCGKSDSTPAGAAGAADAEGPRKAVHEFLSAVKAGDDAKAAAMLTPTAREKTKAAGLDVAPPANDTATFKVGDVETVGDGAAHVACELTDVDGQAQPHTSKIVWVLRQEPEGWRIAGMAMKVFDDQPPVILNFEDPDDMIRKQQLVDEEMQRRIAPPGEQGKAAAASSAKQAEHGGSEKKR